MSAPLIPFRAIDEDGGAFLKGGQAQLLAEAVAMAAANWTQEEIVEELQRQFPGKPSENHYLNPAADAVMRRVRQAERRRVGDAADLARVQVKGYDERKARGYQAPEDAVEEVASPTEGELALVTRGAELTVLCANYGIYFYLDPETGDLRSSRGIEKGGPLHQAVKRCRKGLVAGLKERSGDGTR